MVDDSSGSDDSVPLSASSQSGQRGKEQMWEHFLDARGWKRQLAFFYCVDTDAFTEPACTMFYTHTHCFDVPSSMVLLLLRIVSAHASLCSVLNVQSRACCSHRCYQPKPSSEKGAASCHIASHIDCNVVLDAFLVDRCVVVELAVRRRGRGTVVAGLTLARARLP